MTEYVGEMDPECIALCDAINHIPGLQTTESCCGHGESLFRIWFTVTDPKEFSVLLYYLVPCHVGFLWNCYAKTDCGMSPVGYYIESQVKGEEAYEQANKIAEEIISNHVKRPEQFKGVGS
jgi:hypothetical protein